MFIYNISRTWSDIFPNLNKMICACVTCLTRRYLIILGYYYHMVITIINQICIIMANKSSKPMVETYSGPSYFKVNSNSALKWSPCPDGIMPPNSIIWMGQRQSGRYWNVVGQWTVSLRRWFLFHFIWNDKNIEAFFFSLIRKGHWNHVDSVQKI